MLEVMHKQLANVKILYLKRKFKSIISVDTAGSAKDLAEGKDKS